MRCLSMIQVDESRGLAPGDLLMGDMGEPIEEMSVAGVLPDTAAFFA